MITQERLIEKINALPPSKLSEVSDFVDLLASESTRPSFDEQDELIAQYAAEFGGTRFDLDEDLERAGMEIFVSLDKTVLPCVIR